MSVSDYSPRTRCDYCREVLDEESPDTITDSEGLQFHNTDCQFAFYLTEDVGGDEIF